jgi:hypothetical protein
MDIRLKEIKHVIDLFKSLLGSEVTLSQWPPAHWQPTGAAHDSEVDSDHGCDASDHCEPQCEDGPGCDAHSVGSRCAMGCQAAGSSQPAHPSAVQAAGSSQPAHSSAVHSGSTASSQLAPAHCAPSTFLASCHNPEGNLLATCKNHGHHYVVPTLFKCDSFRFLSGCF